MKKTKSKYEAEIQRQIRRKKVVYEYEGVTVPFIIASHYTPDFTLYTPLGKVYIETKGYFRPESKRKMIAVKKQHPNMDIRMLFQKLTKQNERWAIRNGFRYAEGVIPDEWFKGL